MQAETPPIAIISVAKSFVLPASEQLANMRGGILQQWESAIESYMAFLVAIGRPKTTRDLRYYQLVYLARSTNTPLDRITYDDLIEWFSIHEDWKPETRRSYRSALRGFFAWARKHNLVAEDPAFDLPQMSVPRAVAQPVPDLVLADAVRDADSRVALMLRLAGELGLRRSEVAKVHTRDLRHSPAGAQLVVHGKGSRQRVIPVSAGLATQIAAGAAGHSPGETSEGWLFPSRKGGHLCPAHVGRLCSEALEGIWTMHKARHRFASRAYRGTRNIRAVQELLGHANLAITERYTAVDDDEMRAAMMAATA